VKTQRQSFKAFIGLTIRTKMIGGPEVLFQDLRRNEIRGWWWWWWWW